MQSTVIESQSKISVNEGIRQKLYKDVIKLAEMYDGSSKILWSNLCDRVSFSERKVLLNSEKITESSKLSELGLVKSILTNPLESSHAHKACVETVKRKLNHCNYLCVDKMDEHQKRLLKEKNLVVKNYNIGSDALPNIKKCLFSTLDEDFMINLEDHEILAKTTRNKYGVMLVRPDILNIEDLNYILRILIYPL